MAWIKFAKILINNRNHYLNICKRVTLCNFIKINEISKVRLYTPKFPIKKVALGISLLTWLGFTKEDEDKESELIMTLKRAVLCTQREEFDKAEQMLHLALRMAQQQQNHQGVLYCYDLMANLAFDTLQLDKAEKLFVSVMQMLMGKGVGEYDLRIIHISLKMARIAQLKADLAKAELGYSWCLDHIQKVLSNDKENKDAQGLHGIIHDWYAQYLLDIGDIKKATAHLSQAYDICKDIVEDDGDQSMLLLNDLAIANFRAGELDKAIDLLHQAIKIGERLEENPHVGVMHANLGLILLEKGIKHEAEKWCLQGYRLGKKHDNNEAMEQSNYCLDQIKQSTEK